MNTVPLDVFLQNYGLVKVFLLINASLGHLNIVTWKKKKKHCDLDLTWNEPSDILVYL